MWLSDCWFYVHSTYIHTHRKRCEMIWAGRDRDKAIHRGYEREDMISDRVERAKN